MLAEPILIDEDQECSVSEYLSFFASDKGSQCLLYNYGVDGNDLEYLVDLLPVLVSTERIVKEVEHKQNLKEIVKYVKRKIAALKKNEKMPEITIESETMATSEGTITYTEVRKLMGGKPFTMHLKSEYPRVARIINQGIDSRLQACFVPERGDTNDNGKMSISVESFPVLLRRLHESEDEEMNELADCMLSALKCD